jgi:predicted enzyme related to lactoylglutathione lyase
LVARLLEVSVTTTSRARNGAAQGDLSYITLSTPDLDKAKAFYGAVLGWTFAPGHSPGGAQVLDTVPMIGMWGGPVAAGRPCGAVLGYLVNDLPAAVERARAAGGECTEPRQEPYGWTADGVDPDGIAFWLHSGMGSEAAASENGMVEGDVSYVPDVERSRAFYDRLLQGGVTAPQVGLSPSGSSNVSVSLGGVLCYHVRDARVAAEHVTAAGGTVRDIAQRPYAVEVLAVDDQGIDFCLHEFPS